MSEPATNGVPTPLKVVFAGAALTAIEAMYYIVNAELLAGDVDGVELSTTAIVAINLVGLAFVLALVAYGYSVRHSPTRKSYGIIAVLSVLSLVTGILLANLVTIGAALVGIVARRRKTADRDG